MRVPNRAVIWLLSLSIGGCYTEVDVRGRDEAVFFPALRASVPFGEQSPPPERTDEDAKPVQQRETVIGNRLEFEVSGASGSDQQVIGANEVVNFGDISLFGPGEVNVDWDIYTVSALASIRGKLTPELRLDGLFGLAGTHATTEVARGTTSSRDSTFSFGPQIGARLNWQPHHVVGLYGQMNATWGFGSGGAVTLAGAELAATARVSRVAVIFAGWRWWSYDEDRGGSDLDLGMSGPLLGIGFDF